ncbi:MAG: nucleotidyltransferase domain-containing protein [Elusimicrobiota bacterium]
MSFLNVLIGNPELNMEIKNKKVIDNIVKKIQEEYKPEKIILFGSYAYGKPTSESDVDLLIIKESRKRRIDRFCEVRKIIREIKGISIQPVIFTRAEIKKRLKIGDDFMKEIFEKGKVLYGSQ